MDQRVVDAMMPMFTKHFGNPSSTHDLGMDAADYVDSARKDVATLIGAETGDVVFTSGATEANNMAVHGLAMNTDMDRRILYGAAEHKSVIGPCLAMGCIGLKALPVKVTPTGVADLDHLTEMLRVPTDMVSIALANSETGVINPIKEISKAVHDHGAILHSDITQAVGKINVDVQDLGIDIATCSSHKVYGPKGCGALVASREVRKKMIPMVYGGGQENNLRSGTENVPGIVGFGAACQIAYGEMANESPRLMMLRDSFERKMKSEMPDIAVNGEGAQRLPNTSNIRIMGALADAVMTNSTGIDISTGSACSSSTMEPSHVLTAMGLDRTAADESIRVSLGRPTTMEDIETAVSKLAKAAEFVRGRELAVQSGRAV